MAKQINNSTDTIKGIIYQFLVALEKCFEMQENDTVYIETYGDVSIIGDNSIQIESKFYNSYLSDLDHNIWNTLNNWIQDEFPLQDFSSLVLLTTQKVRSTSSWYAWNTKKTSEKLVVLMDIQKKFLKQRKKSNETEMLLNSVFDQSKQNRLHKVIDLFVIENNSIDDKIYYNQIKGKYTKHIPSIRADQYMRAMFGYIISPKIIDNNWQISYKDFSQESISLTQKLVDTTMEFPSKIQSKHIAYENYLNNRFVEKIKKIQYDSVVSDAITDFAQTRELIIQEFNVSHAISNSLKQYEDNLMHRYGTKYKKASRNCDTNNLVSKSQDFYDDMMDLDSGTFYIYNSVPPYFQNGYLHILAEEDNNINWLLNPDIL